MFTKLPKQRHKQFRHCEKENNFGEATNDRQLPKSFNVPGSITARASDSTCEPVQSENIYRI